MFLWRPASEWTDELKYHFYKDPRFALRIPEKLFLTWVLSTRPNFGHLLIANIKRVPQSAGGIVSQYRRIGYIEEGVHLEDNNNILLNILKSYKEGIHLEDSPTLLFKKWTNWWLISPPVEIFHQSLHPVQGPKRRMGNTLKTTDVQIRHFPTLIPVLTLDDKYDSDVD